MVKQLFVNLPVKNLPRTIRFFTALGFKFNPAFTDKNATCLILGKDMYAMLLVEPFFKTFIQGKKISNAKKTTEVLVSLSLENRAKVDEMMRKAVKAGGKDFRKAQDYGWMYGRAFEDLDGHVWEVFYMNERQMPKKPNQT